MSDDNIECSSANPFAVLGEDASCWTFSVEKVEGILSKVGMLSVLFLSFLVCFHLTRFGHSVGLLAYSVL